MVEAAPFSGTRADAPPVRETSGAAGVVQRRLKKPFKNSALKTNRFPSGAPVPMRAV